MRQISLLAVVFIWLLCTATQCNREDCHRIKFVNISSKDLYVIAPFGSRQIELDTLNIHIMFGSPPWPELYLIESGKERLLGLRRRDCFDYWVELGHVYVYVFDAEVLATVPWDTIVKDYMVLKIYHPTIEEMKNSDWTITYTGE